MSVAGGGYLPRRVAARLTTFIPLATSPSVNNCYPFFLSPIPPTPFFSSSTPTLELLFHFYSDIKSFPQSSVLMSHLEIMNINKQLSPTRARNTRAI